ncbi:MAG TPA: bifunctional phosphoglucose/phosphomannose isomerase [Candidatus Sulfotelmatobacter sp.]|nr:bifunctional phosphoglucose/phosphomannose isomerase [Candidatus Sulfotelmatobacter sp.]
MPTILDNQKAMSSHDTKNMLGAVEKFPEFIASQLRATPLIGKNPKRLAISNIVFMGMGGSASAGDLVMDWLADKISYPGVVHRDPVLPRFVSSSTLFVALSYSGETRETLAAFREARKRGSNLVAIGTGGRLQKLSKELDVPFLAVQPAPAPRAALGQMVVATIIALSSQGVTRDPTTEINLASQELRRLSKRIERQVPFARNPAKRLAGSLKARLPMIYTFQRMASVARRFKNQLAENSKMVAKYGLLPEAGHNEVEAWFKPSLPLAPIFIRDHSESKFEESLLQSFRSTIVKASRITPTEVRLKASTRLGGLLLPVLFLDFVSVYLAFLQGIDPTDTPWIRLFRKGIGGFLATALCT